MFTSEALFDRKMSVVVAGPRKARTLALPNTVIEVHAGALEWTDRLRRVVLDEGLETIGKDAFRCTELESVTFPASLKIC